MLPVCSRLPQLIGVLLLLTATVLVGQVPDANLIANPGFESGGTGFTDWSYYQNNGSGTLSVAGTPNTHSGARAALLTVYSPSDLGVNTAEPGIIPVAPNTNYTISGWVKNGGIGQSSCLRIIEWQLGNPAARADDWPSGVCSSASSTAWQFVQGTFTTGTSTNAVSVRIMGHLTVGTFYWDDLRLQRTSTNAIYVTAAPTGPCVPTHSCLTSSWSAADKQIQFGSDGKVDTNAELDRWAAIYQDVRGGGSCAPAAAQVFADRLTNVLNAGPVSDSRTPGMVDYFHQWLVGAMVTHIYAAAREIDYNGVSNSLAPLLAQVKTRYGGNVNQTYDQRVNIDPGCGVPGNSCMDDHSLAASGYAWLAAFEYQKLRSPEPYRSWAWDEVTYALAPMSSRYDPSTYGGGPCVDSTDSNSSRCTGTTGTWDPLHFRVIGADHDQENPNYGLGQATGVASACAALYMSGSTCGNFSGSWNGTVLIELLKTAQQRASTDGSDWDQGGCVHFPDSQMNPCDDHTYLGLTADSSYKPRDFDLSAFFGKRGISGGFPRDTAFQFDSYCEPRTVWAPPYDRLWGPNRFSFYHTYAGELYGADNQAPRTAVAYPPANTVLTGAVTLQADTADNVRVSYVNYYVDGGYSPIYMAYWPYSDYVDTSSGNDDGTYNLLVRSFDDVGNNATSASVPITVSNPRVNAGGTGFVDQYGKHWFSDYGYNTGYLASTAASIADTDLPQLYQTCRWYTNPLTYTFAVGNGQRTVKLRFAEFVYTYPGARYFNVLINGTQVLTNFDIVAAGGAFSAVDRSFSVNITNQQVTITFVPVHENPMINAIEIY